MARLTVIILLSGIGGDDGTGGGSTDRGIPSK